MQIVDTDETGLARVLGRFPGHETRLCTLYVTSFGFRCLCSDLLLAIDTLARFKCGDGTDHSAEIEDYSRLIPELEAELMSMLVAPVI